MLKKKNNVPKIEPLPLILFIIGCNGIGSLGSLFTMPNIPTWYSTLAKPEFITPPNWVFGPVWTALFTLMGIAAYRVWRFGKKGQHAMQLFVLQFVLNLLWSLLFFGLQSPVLGVLGIIFLWGSIAATIVSFSKIEKTAALLLIPYILWVTFAGILNVCVAILNRV